MAIDPEDNVADSATAIVGQGNDMEEEDEQTLIDNEVQPDGAERTSQLTESKTWQKLGRKSTRRRKQQKWYRHRGLKENRHTVIITAVIVVLSLFALGSGIGILAVHNFNEATTDGVILLVLGAIMLIPGMYFTYYIWMAAHSRPGFDFNSLKRFAFN